MNIFRCICIFFYRKLVNNHTFFQHPDLIRILRVHENVMAVMMNTLGRRAQAQSDTQAQIQATGQEGEAPPKEKVEHQYHFSCFLVPFSF
jgi:ryanodine receptor 2